MKTKDIQPGIAYARRGGTKFDWGVPVSVERRYETGRFDDSYLREGKSILVLAPGSRASITRLPATPATREEAAAVAAGFGEVAPGASLDELNDRLNDRGLHADLWQPAQFVGEYEEAIAAREEERRQREEADEAIWARRDRLEARWEALRETLDLEAAVRVNSGAATFSEEGFARILDRLEVLAAGSPLITGQI